jgi:hypothetical protein
MPNRFLQQPQKIRLVAMSLRNLFSPEAKVMKIEKKSRLLKVYGLTRDLVKRQKVQVASQKSRVDPAFLRKRHTVTEKASVLNKLAQWIYLN